MLEYKGLKVKGSLFTNNTQTPTEPWGNRFPVLTPATNRDTVKPMKRIKSGKTIRVPDSALQGIRELREKMEHVSHIGGLKLNPYVTLSDGVVVAFGLFLANLAMSPAHAIIDRKKMQEKLFNDVVKHIPEFVKRSEDEQRALFGLMFSSHCEFSAYDNDGPVKAAAVGSSEPS